MTSVAAQWRLSTGDKDVREEAAFRTEAEMMQDILGSIASSWGEKKNKTLKWRWVKKPSRFGARSLEQGDAVITAGETVS